MKKRRRESEVRPPSALSGSTMITRLVSNEKFEILITMNKLSSFFFKSWLIGRWRVARSEEPVTRRRRRRPGLPPPLVVVRVRAVRPPHDARLLLVSCCCWPPAGCQRRRRVPHDVVPAARAERQASTVPAPSLRQRLHGSRGCGLEFCSSHFSLNIFNGWSKMNVKNELH